MIVRERDHMEVACWVVIVEEEDGAMRYLYVYGMAA